MTPEIYTWSAVSLVSGVIVNCVSITLPLALLMLYLYHKKK